MQGFMARTMKFLHKPDGETWDPPRPATDRPLLLYLHVPFCQELCTFCSFNRVKYRGPVAAEYFDALRSEIQMYYDLGYKFDSVYVGGGTPTIAPRELESTLSLVKDLWPVRKISTETNPSHLTPELMQLLKDLGVSRLSVGVQSFDDGVLKSIGRYDRYGSGREIHKYLESAAGIFDTLNVDLIFNYPDQTEEMLRRDLRIIGSLHSDQVTIYPLMSASARKENARRPHRHREHRFYSAIREELEEHYTPTSAWCYSRKDHAGEGLIDEYIVDYEDYAGLGAGSFGYLEGTMYSNTFDIPEYINRLKRNELPLAARKVFSPREQVRYYYLMKLFSGSLEIERIRPEFRGAAIRRIWKELLFFRTIGAVKIRHGAVELTDKGLYLWLVLMREFFTGVNLFRDQCRPAEHDPESGPIRRTA